MTDKYSVSTAKTKQISKKSLIELNYLLFIIIFSLSLEWFINKYFGEF